jgi:hypothetical protein
MENYKNKGGNSGVCAFGIGADYIEVEFDGAVKTYTYSYRKAGKVHVDRMKSLAQSGSGLNSYINKNVKFSYD